MSISAAATITSSHNPVSILVLLATPAHILAYSLPLFFLSLALTFTGAFLTLDRTRVFKAKEGYSDLNIPGGFASKKGKFERIFKLEGGLGGVIGGWAFGFHLATFLALLIPSLPDTKISKSLSPTSFIAVYLLVSISTAFLGGRFKYAALAMAGLVGGITFSLALGVITHPSLLTRLVFLGITTPILLLFTLLPLVRFQHGALRFAWASTGSFGLVTAIALLSSLKAGEASVQAGVWWCHYFVKDGIGWGTANEKGLCAAYCLFLVFGTAADWALKRKFGECPDEKWDSYLANYTTSGNLPDRAGTYLPATSLWDRLTKSHSKDQDIIFPDDPDSKEPLPPYELPLTLRDTNLRKSKGSRRSMVSHGHGRKSRAAVKFRPIEGVDDDSSDEDDVWDDRVKRPWLRHQPSSTSSTTPTLVGDEGLVGFKAKKVYDLDPSKTGHLRKPPPLFSPKSSSTNVNVDYDREIKLLRETKIKGMKGMGDGEIPDYSDHEDGEEDITATKEREKQRGRGRDSPRKVSGSSIPSDTSGSTVVEHNRLSSSQPPTGVMSSMPVPATPSLIKALDRVALAQKDAFSGTGLPSVSEEDRREGHGQKWEVFWKEVREKSSKEDLR